MSNVSSVSTIKAEYLIGNLFTITDRYHVSFSELENLKKKIESSFEEKGISVFVEVDPSSVTSAVHLNSSYFFFDCGRNVIKFKTQKRERFRQDVVCQLNGTVDENLHNEVLAFLESDFS